MATGRSNGNHTATRTVENIRGLAALNQLTPVILGSPTWARTRDLRINRLPLDLPGNPHECSLFGVCVSNKSRPFHLRNAWEGSVTLICRGNARALRQRCAASDKRSPL